MTPRVPLFLEVSVLLHIYSVCQLVPALQACSGVPSGCVQWESDTIASRLALTMLRCVVQIGEPCHWDKDEGEAALLQRISMHNPDTAMRFAALLLACLVRLPSPSTLQIPDVHSLSSKLHSNQSPNFS